MADQPTSTGNQTAAFFEAMGINEIRADRLTEIAHYCCYRIFWPHLATDNNHAVEDLDGTYGPGATGIRGGFPPSGSLYYGKDGGTEDDMYCHTDGSIAKHA